MKIAMISGASGGIGGETVKVFAQNGYFVLGLYNKGEKAIERLKADLLSQGLSDFFFAYKCDLRSKDSVADVLSKISASFKHIDVLVNAAGVGLYKTFTDTSEKEWDDIFKVNVKSAFTLSKYALKSMLPLKSGRIINVSSIWGKCGAAMETAYSTTKAALIGLTESLAKEVAPSNITVNCVCPGVIDTPMNARFSKAEIGDLIDRTPLRRLGSPREIAQIIYFLTTDAAAFITGQAIICDGGFTL